MIHLKAHDFLFVQGDAADRMYVLRRGRLRRFRRLGDEVQPLNDVLPGQLLGVLSLLDNTPRSSTTQALEDCELTVVDQPTLRGALTLQPRWISSLLRTWVKRLKFRSGIQRHQQIQRSVPAMLWCLRQNAPDQKGFPESSLSVYMHLLCGLPEWDTRLLLQQLETLGLTRLPSSSLYDRLLQVLHARSLHHPEPGWLLSAGEQRILNCWIEAARSHGEISGTDVKVRQMDFQEALRRHIPGARLGVSALSRLQKQRLLICDADQNLQGNYDEILEILECRRLLTRIETELPSLLENF